MKNIILCFLAIVVPPSMLNAGEESGGGLKLVNMMAVGNSGIEIIPARDFKRLEMRLSIKDIDRTSVPGKPGLEAFRSGKEILAEKLETSEIFKLEKAQ